VAALTAAALASGAYARADGRQLARAVAAA
jgi:hypothetical protein